MRTYPGCILFTAFTMALAGALGCSSNSSAPETPSGGVSKAQLRFKNTSGATWQMHIAAGKNQVSSFSYRISVGSIPLPVRFNLGALADGDATDYQAVDAATIKDENVLHEWSYNYNQGSSSTYIGASVSKQLYGQLGINLMLTADGSYTVEVGTSPSKLVEDP